MKRIVTAFAAVAMIASTAFAGDCEKGKEKETTKDTFIAGDHKKKEKEEKEEEKEEKALLAGDHKKKEKEEKEEEKSELV